MHRTINIDSEGKLLVAWELEQDQPINTVDQSMEERRSKLKHLRRMQSTNFIGRSAIKVSDALSALKKIA